MKRRAQVCQVEFVFVAYSFESVGGKSQGGVEAECVACVAEGHREVFQEEAGKELQPVIVGVVGHLVVE
ncbi:MAG: hypothetical protein EXQ52_09555 [Bryobacterales bacterium]|nr:hypothetical protein [Bryobacterales bacterium]